MARDLATAQDDLKEATMRSRMVFLIAIVALAVAGCVIEPYGRGGHYYGDDYYGRRVWRG